LCYLCPIVGLFRVHGRSPFHGTIGGSATELAGARTVDQGKKAPARGGAVSPCRSGGPQGRPASWPGSRVDPVAADGQLDRPACAWSSSSPRQELSMARTTHPVREGRPTLGAALALMAAGTAFIVAPKLVACHSTQLSGYASDSEFSVCRCGSNMWCNRVNSEKLNDPGLLLQRKRNAWWRPRPDS
jgi:hypothetical protein